MDFSTLFTIPVLKCTSQTLDGEPATVAADQWLPDWKPGKMLAGTKLMPSGRDSATYVGCVVPFLDSPQ